MRRKAQEPLFSSEEPPAELCRYSVAQHVAGNYGGFEDWLRARQEWRRTHDRPLPHLFARDRHALNSITSLDPQVVSTEKAAPKAEPEWAERARAKAFSQQGDIGPLPVVARPEAPWGVPGQGVDE